MAEKQTSQDDQTLQSLSTTSLPRKTTQAETLVQGLLGILLVTTSGGYLPSPFPRKFLVENLCVVTQVDGFQITLNPVQSYLRLLFHDLDHLCLKDFELHGFLLIAGIILLVLTLSYNEVEEAVEDQLDLVPVRLHGGKENPHRGFTERTKLFGTGHQITITMKLVLHRSRKKLELLIEFLFLLGKDPKTFLVFQLLLLHLGLDLLKFKLHLFKTHFLFSWKNFNH
ncbi:MAG: hypothetical protein ACYCQJ_13515 [Nitrososphaerales archaeon]